MDTNNIGIGDIYKSYGKLCEALGTSPRTGGSSKIAHIKEIGRHISYTKSGNSFIITDIYQIPIPQKHYGKLFIDTQREKLKHLISSMGYDINILAENSSKILTWRCETCEKVFLSKVETISRNSLVRCIDCKQSKDSRAIKKLLDSEIINYKMEHTFDDLNGDSGLPLKFDYAVFSYDNELLGLIEYDGGFHDTNLKTQKYDVIKDKYCTDNNMQLLRVHHTEEFKTLKVIDFLEDIGCEFLFGRIKDIKNKFEQDIKREINKIEEDMNKLEQRKGALRSIIDR